MPKTDRRAKVPTKARSTKKKNAPNRTEDIFKLIDLIPKQKNSFLPFKKEKANFNFASSLLVYCEKRYPAKLKDLFFDKKNTLGDLIYELLEIVYSENEKVSYVEHHFEEESNYDCISFINKEVDYDWCWYVMEGKHHLQIKSRELKTVFFKILQKFSKSTEVSFLDHNFKNFNDTHFDEICDYLEQTYEENIDDSDDEEHEPFNEYFDRMMEPIKNCIEEYNSHIHLDPDNKIFDNYVPKNEYEEKVKELLKKGLYEIDFHIFHRFADHTNPFEDGDEKVMFSQSFLTFYDCTEDSPFEYEILENYNFRTNDQEVTYPAKYFTVKKGKMEERVTENDSKELKKLCNYLCEFAQFFDV